MKSLSLIIWPLEHYFISQCHRSMNQNFLSPRRRCCEGRASESGDPAGVLFLGGERDEIRPDIVCREKASWLNSSLEKFKSYRHLLLGTHVCLRVVSDGAAWGPYLPTLVVYECCCPVYIIILFYIIFFMYLIIIFLIDKSRK